MVSLGLEGVLRFCLIALLSSMRLKESDLCGGLLLLDLRWLWCREILVRGSRRRLMRSQRPHSAGLLAF